MIIPRSCFAEYCPPPTCPLFILERIHPGFQRAESKRNQTVGFSKEQTKGTPQTLTQHAGEALTFIAGLQFLTGLPLSLQNSDSEVESLKGRCQPCCLSPDYTPLSLIDDYRSELSICSLNQREDNANDTLNRSDSLNSFTINKRSSRLLAT